ncbi:GNAT family N-acetyltransferase [Actinomycetaceae bacterium L2_0104]
MGEEFRVLDASVPSEREEWVTVWNRWPEREVQAHPEFALLFSHDSERALAADYRTGAGTHILYPFVLREIDSMPGFSGYRDITIPFGYGGPATWGPPASEAETSSFWAHVDEWAAANGVVSEFIGFGLSKSFDVRYPGEKILRKPHIVVDLERSYEDLWSSFDRKVRKNVNKAVRDGITISVDEDGRDFEAFHDIYFATMERHSAAEDFFFPREFFESIHEKLPGQFAYFHAYFEGVPVSTELALVSERSVYSFLGGTLPAYFPHRPNDLLKVEIMKWGQAHGKQHFVLGGGVTAGDGIERYKRAFAPQGDRDFYTGQRVLDRKAYEFLVAAQGTENTLEEGGPTSFFPAYRART